MIVEVNPTTVVVNLGEPVTVFVTIVNTEAIISAHEVTVLGADPSWVEQDQRRLSLFPEGVGVVTLTIQLPPGIPAGTRRVAVQVREITAPGAIEVVEVELVVPARHGTRIDLEPPSVTGTSEATVAVVLENDGNAELDIILVGTDADMAVRFAFEPGGVVLPAGERYTATARLRAKRPLTGSPKVRQYTIAATVPDEEPVAVTGTFIQKPRITRGAIALLGMLAVISIFAAVIAATFGRVADKSDSDRDLVLEALREGDDGGPGGGTGSISGTVTLLTGGTPVPGVTVELFQAADAGVALANAATESDGTYSFTDLGEGRFKLRFRGAGFTELWFPLALTSEDADEVELGPGQVVEGIDIRLGGVPASVAGTVSGDDVAGAAVSVRLPSVAANPTDPAPAAGATATTGVVATVAVDASGAFVIPNLPSPSVYEISASKEGFATEFQSINLSAGEERTGLSFNLRRGDGTIAGRVLSPSGNLGGATIAASDGRTTIRTVSLTRDDVGAFTLRNLPTPATYTIVFSAPGHVTQTLTVALGVAERRDGVVALLGTDAGSISGTVSVAGAGPAGGVRVRATSGETVVETVTLSTGDVGSYTLVGLLVPGTYTVTFERDDLASQTRSVDLDTLGRQNVTGVDATLQPANATVFGTVTDQEGNPLGEVTVTLTSGGRTFQTTTATEPPGAYEVRGIPPGTYSASFTRVGSTPAALLVTVGAGDRVELNAVLTARAAIRGTVFFMSQTNDPPEQPLPGAQVRLFTCAAYGQPNPIPPPEFDVTDAQGRFSFTDLEAPECYVLDFAPPGANAPVQQSRLVTLDPGEDLDISAEGSGVQRVVLTTQ